MSQSNSLSIENPVYLWLSKNIYVSKSTGNSAIKFSDKCLGLIIFENGKINSKSASIFLDGSCNNIEYPFGVVDGTFACYNCKNIESFKNFPEIINGKFNCMFCDNLKSFKGLPKYIKGEFYFRNHQFSNDPTQKKRYNIYLDMWYELLDSVSDSEKITYLNNYRDRGEYYGGKPILPKEVINKYKIGFLLNKK